MKSVLIPLVPLFEDIEAITVIDVLRRGGVEVTTVSLSDDISVASAHGVVVRADCLLAETTGREYDAIVLPGGPVTDALFASGPLLERLRHQRREGGLIAAICAAPTVLTRARIIDSGVHLTCYPTCEPLLDRPSTREAVTVDGTLITARAPGSATEFAVAVLSALAGEETAESVTAGMCYQRAPAVTADAFGIKPGS